MNTFLMLLLFGCLSLAGCATVAATDEPPAYEGYELVWRDEFDQAGPPDPEAWGHERGFVRNNELQWYQPDHAFCEDGVLVIEARRVDRPNPRHDPDSDDWRTNRPRIEYTAASINTSGKHEWTYGRFEIRAKIPAKQGMWPAIWTLGSARDWPHAGEIDIMEFYRGKILANAAWGNERRWQAVWDSSATPVEELADNDTDRGDVAAWAGRFHVWRMDWDQTAIKLYIDGKLLNTIELDKTVNRTPGAENPFHEPHYLLLNLAIGGNNGGDPGETPFPQRYLVDYVRVYQKAESLNEDNKDAD